MKVAAITGPRQSELQEVPNPKVRENFVLVRIEVAPMCTEYKGYKDGWASNVLGHEAAGEVVEVAQPGQVKVGDRVVVMPQFPCGLCKLCLAGDYIHCEDCVDPLALCGSETGLGTYAEYCIKQDWLCLPVPEGMSYEHASMACCGLGPTFGAMQRMKVDAFDTVLIAGLGPVGLGGVINARFRGARVIGLESNPYRASLALELGAEAIINPEEPEALAQVKALTDRGRGVDKAIDCTAVPTAQSFCMDATRRRGEVAFVGWGGRIERDLPVPQGLTLHGCWHFNRQDAPRLMQVLASTSASLDKLITHSFSLSEVQAAWELQLTGQCGKVLLYPGR